LLDRLDAPRELLAEPALAADIGRSGTDRRHWPKILVSHVAKLNGLATRKPVR